MLHAIRTSMLPGLVLTALAAAPLSTHAAESPVQADATVIPALAGVDTRALARHLRETGCLRGIVTAPGATDPVAAVAAATGAWDWAAAVIAASSLAGGLLALRMRALDDR